MDVARDTRSAEAAEQQIATFIARMDTKRRDTEGERLEEELYAESVRRFNEKARAEIRLQWISYHQNLCRLHTQLADEHEREAQQLLEGA